MMKNKEYYIWTHFCAGYGENKPWSAMRLDSAEEDPYETIAELGEHSGTCFGATELEAIQALIESEKECECTFRDKAYNHGCDICNP